MPIPIANEKEVKNIPLGNIKELKVTLTNPIVIYSTQFSGFTQHVE